MDISDGDSKKLRASMKIKRQTSRTGSTKLKKKEGSPKRLDHGHNNSDTIEILEPTNTDYIQDEDGEPEEEKTKHKASIKGMWMKALKSLTSNDTKQLPKKGILPKKKDSESEEEATETFTDIDPVYCLLKCAADLPKIPKPLKISQCTTPGCKGDRCDGSCKVSTPASSGVGSFPEHPAYNSQQSIEGAPTAGRRESRATSPAITNREHMHHIVDESLGSEFRTFYKLTSPVKKSLNDAVSKKLSPNSSFDHY